MTTEVCQEVPLYLTTNSSPSRKDAAIQPFWEKNDPQMEAHFLECKESGRPYIDHEPGSGTFNYIYFDRSRYPGAKLIRRLNLLGRQFAMEHEHVITGSLFEVCFDTPDSIPYQGRFHRMYGAWSPEKTRSFVSRLDRLLPRFDRRGVIRSMVARSIKDGYFTSSCEALYGDENLEQEAVDAYRERCQDHAQPFIIYREEEGYIYYRHGKALTAAAAVKVGDLTRSFGVAAPDGETDGPQLYGMIKDGPGCLEFADFEECARYLREILSDPVSYEPRPE